MQRIRRGGRYLRVADPGWEDPLDGSYAELQGGRWNPPGAYPVVYLNASVAVARANALLNLAGQPYGPEDLNPDTAPILVETTVPDGDYLDAVTKAGLQVLGLPATYPRQSDGTVVGHSVCQPIGKSARDAGLPGVACLSAAPKAPTGGEEVAWFQGPEPLTVTNRVAFVDWFW